MDGRESLHELLMLIRVPESEKETLIEYSKNIIKELELKECYEKNQIPYLQEISHNYSDLLKKLRDRKEEEIKMIDDLLKKYE